MKFLNIDALVNLSNIFNKYDTGDTILNSRLDAFSCKRVGSDKKLYSELENYYNSHMTKNPQAAFANTAFGPLFVKKNREILIELISILNAMFGDYDFRDVGPDRFFREDSLSEAMSKIDSILMSYFPNYEKEIKNNFWTILDQEIGLRECCIFSFVPDGDCNPFSEDGYIWSYNFFFYNKKKNLNRVVVFTLSAKWKQTSYINEISDNGEEWSEYDEYENHEESNFLCSDEDNNMDIM